jgi:CO/xanthine dehydrogenase FAD-binding subunit
VLANPSRLIDLQRIVDLGGIEEAGGAIRIGAITTMAEGARLLREHLEDWAATRRAALF